MKSNAHTKDVIKMIPGIENENTHKLQQEQSWAVAVVAGIRNKLPRKQPPRTETPGLGFGLRLGLDLGCLGGLCPVGLWSWFTVAVTEYKYNLCYCHAEKLRAHLS